MEKKRKNLNINDRYDVLLDWEDLKETMEEARAELRNFYSPRKVKRSAVRSRKLMSKMINSLKEIRAKVNKQRQDYDSEY
jgi:hypothetical protein